MFSHLSLPLIHLGKQLTKAQQYLSQIQEKTMTKIINLSPSEIQLLKEELDIDDEMDEADEKQSEDDPYFLLAQRLANAPQVKVRQQGVPTSFG